MANDIFEKKLEVYKNYARQEVIDTSIYSNDTFDQCQATAQSVFGDKSSLSDTQNL